MGTAVTFFLLCSSSVIFIAQLGAALLLLLLLPSLFLQGSLLALLLCRSHSLSRSVSFAVNGQTTAMHLLTICVRCYKNKVIGRVSR